jgi:hypothetical protein
MNGKTTIDAIHNPCSAEMDRKTYGWESLNVCFWGKRLIRFTVGRLTMDIYAGIGRTFTCMGGGANGTARYWNLFWPLGSVMWITRKSNGELCDGGRRASELKQDASRHSQQ